VHPTASLSGLFSTTLTNTNTASDCQTGLY